MRASCGSIWGGDPHAARLSRSWGLTKLTGDQYINKPGQLVAETLCKIKGCWLKEVHQVQSPFICGLYFPRETLHEVANGLRRSGPLQAPVAPHPHIRIYPDLLGPQVLPESHIHSLKT